MKKAKLLLSLLCLLIVHAVGWSGAGQALAADASQPLTVSYDFKNEAYGLEREGTTYHKEGETIENDGVVIVFHGNDAIRLWSDGLRLYNKSKGTKLEVKAPKGYAIASISWTLAANGSFYVNGESNKTPSTDAKLGTWTATSDLTSVYMEVTHTSGNRALVTLTVTLKELPAEPEPEPGVAAITVKYDGNTVEDNGSIEVYNGDSIEVALVNAEDPNAVISYMTDEVEGEIANGTLTFTQNGTFTYLFYNEDLDVEFTLNVTVKEKTAQPLTVTYDFENNAYGMTIYSSSNDKYNTNPVNIENDGVVIIAEGGNNRLWNSSGKVDYRLYKGTKLTVKAPKGYAVESIIWDGTCIFKINGSNSTTSAKTLWSASAGEYLSFVEMDATHTSGNKTITTFTVTLKEIVKTAPELKVLVGGEAVSSIEMNYDESKVLDFTPNGVGNITVAGGEGVVEYDTATKTLKAVGYGKTAELTITSAANDIYLAGETTLEVIVNPLQLTVAEAEEETLSVAVNESLPLTVSILPADAVINAKFEDDGFAEWNPATRTLTGVAEGETMVTFSSECCEDAVLFVNVFNPNKLAAPTFGNVKDSYYVGDVVTMSCTTEGAVLEYRFDEEGEWLAYPEEGIRLMTATEATILEGRATLNGKIAEAEEIYFSVSKKSMIVVFNSEEVSLGVGATTTNAYELVTEPEGAEAHAFTFTSSNERVATVDNTGKVSAIAVGKATITISFTGDDEWEAVEDSYIVNVMNSVSVTYDFVNNDYGMTRFTSGNDYNPDPTEIKNGNVSIVLTGRNRLWSDTGLRLHKASAEASAANIELKANDGCMVTSIEWVMAGAAKFEVNDVEVTASANKVASWKDPNGVALSTVNMAYKQDGNVSLKTLTITLLVPPTIMVKYNGEDVENGGYLTVAKGESIEVAVENSDDDDAFISYIVEDLKGQGGDAEEVVVDGTVTFTQNGTFTYLFDAEGVKDSFLLNVIVKDEVEKEGYDTTLDFSANNYGMPENAIPNGEANHFTGSNTGALDFFIHRDSRARLVKDGDRQYLEVPYGSFFAIGIDNYNLAITSIEVVGEGFDNVVANGQNHANGVYDLSSLNNSSVEFVHGVKSVATSAGMPRRAAAEDAEPAKLYSVKVTTSIATGVEMINDADADVEYYDLQGRRVDGALLLPGLYIRRQGSETLKVLVK